MISEAVDHPSQELAEGKPCRLGGGFHLLLVLWIQVESACCFLLGRIHRLAAGSLAGAAPAL